MARAPSPAVDPAVSAGALLRRLGFATLTLAVPAAALVARRAIVVLVPVGVTLLVLASALDGKHRPLGTNAGRFLSSRGAIAGLVLLGWCALSLLWTPFLNPASERFISILSTVAVAVVGYLALPDRMRSADLYLIPIGAGIAALGAVLLVLSGAPSGPEAEEYRQNLDRGLTVTTLLIWPGVAWLQSRGRGAQGLAVAVFVAAAAALGPRPMPVIALATGALAFAITAAAPRAGVMVTAAIMAGLLALSPLIPLAVHPLATSVLGAVDTTIVQNLGIWGDVIVGDPVRLITGHGFETASRGRSAGLVPSGAPSTLLFEVWYELGIVGAFAGAFALFAAARTAGGRHPTLAPGAMAAFATAYAFACLGIGTAQMWWFTALAALVLIFVAIERGQFRTKRPKAQRLRPANDA